MRFRNWTSKKPFLASIGTGVLWSFLLQGTLQLSLPVFPLLFAGSIVGAWVFLLSQDFYQRSTLALLFWTIPSTFLAAFLFGGLVGSFDGTLPGANAQGFRQGAAAALLGLIWFPPLWISFVLAFLNHLLIKKIYHRAHQVMV